MRYAAGTFDFLDASGIENQLALTRGNDGSEA
jgi:hypothetical protein